VTATARSVATATLAARTSWPAGTTRSWLSSRPSGRIKSNVACVATRIAFEYKLPAIAASSARTSCASLSALAARRAVLATRPAVEESLYRVGPSISWRSLSPLGAGAAVASSLPCERNAKRSAECLNGSEPNDASRKTIGGSTGLQRLRQERDETVVISKMEHERHQHKMVSVGNDLRPAFQSEGSRYERDGEIGAGRTQNQRASTEGE
jgi:hypothetical protein